jgi:hypothetical protein
MPTIYRTDRRMTTAGGTLGISRHVEFDTFASLLSCGLH